MTFIALIVTLVVTFALIKFAATQLGKSIGRGMADGMDQRHKPPAKRRSPRTLSLTVGGADLSPPHRP
jgi:hypothetical protein